MTASSNQIKCVITWDGQSLIFIHFIFVFLKKVYYLFFLGKPYNINLTFYILIGSPDLFQFVDWSYSSILFHFIPFWSDFFRFFGKIFFDQIYFYDKPDNFCCKHFLIGAAVPIYSILFHFDLIFSDFFEKFFRPNLLLW